jgi:N-methylhydantoinase A/oxoprolinase/acetone carboxylase beta subunit
LVDDGGIGARLAFGQPPRSATFMPILLGIDTGGTYTDAVLFDPARGVLASAKRLTTRHDLAEGVAAAIAAVTAGNAEPIALVSLSTTLATNAVVEGQGSSACLILIGYPPGAAERSGLARAVAGDPVVRIAGGHGSHGEERGALDLAAAEAAVRAHAPQVAAFAVAGYFAVRNPAHEIAVRGLIHRVCDRPVTCGHELTSALDAPRRALTALLNARLVPQIDRLIRAVRATLDDADIRAPLMVVKGDGSLISDRTALARPVETVLSGPAASVVGAQYLTGESDVVVSDIGGTTTDIAVLTGGRPGLSRSGARIGGWHTMVEAVEIHTVGLGGDSEVRIDPAEGLVLGPRRAVPLSLLIDRHPHLLAALERQVAAPAWSTLHGRFAERLRPLDAAMEPLSAAERRIWDALAGGPQPLDALVTSHLLDRPLGRLADRGLVILSAFTPSDAAHVTGDYAAWSAEAAALGAALWLRRPAEAGWSPPADIALFAAAVREAVVRQSAAALTEAALAWEGVVDAAAAARSPVVRRALAGQAGPLLAPAVRLVRPLAGIGAAAAAYYPEIARRLGTRLVLPLHAGVTNAVGAVASGVVQSVCATVTASEDGCFHVHLPSGLALFGTLAEAAAYAGPEAHRLAEAQALAAGAAQPEIAVTRNDRVVRLAGGHEVFVESVITATAVGRPRWVGEG